MREQTADDVFMLEHLKHVTHFFEFSSFTFYMIDANIVYGFMGACMVTTRGSSVRVRDHDVCFVLISSQMPVCAERARTRQPKIQTYISYSSFIHTNI